MAVILTWEDLDEHIDKGDLSEWIAEERAKDKARQLSEQADTPQTAQKVAELQKMCGIEIDPDRISQTDCGWK